MNLRERRYYQAFGDTQFHWLDHTYAIAFVRATDLAEFLRVPPHLFTRYIHQLDAHPTTPLSTSKIFQQPTKNVFSAGRKSNV